MSVCKQTPRKNVQLEKWSSKNATNMSSYNLPKVTRYRFPVISFHDYLHYQRNEKRAECIVELHKHVYFVNKNANRDQMCSFDLIYFQPK